MMDHDKTNEIANSPVKMLLLHCTEVKVLIMIKIVMKNATIIDFLDEI